MKSITALLAATTIALTTATTTPNHHHQHQHQHNPKIHNYQISTLIDQINTNPSSTWTAEFTPQSLDLDYARAQFNTQIGSISNRYEPKEEQNQQQPRGNNKFVLRDLPLSYDVREAFPQCSQPRNVMDQGPFGICWAAATMGAASDRYCIAKKDPTRLFSVVDLVTCCPRCGSTGGGDPEKANYYLAQTGVVSGHSDYQNMTQCVKFPFPQCDHLAPRWDVHDDGDYGHNNGVVIGGNHHNNLVETLPGSGIFISNHPNHPNHHRGYESGGNDMDELKPCRDYIDDWVFPKSCTKRCDGGSPRSYNSDLVRGKDAYSVYGEAQIMNDIFQFGSVVGVFDVYEDFLWYKSGVYSHDVPTQRLGLHAVVIIGWGEEEREVVVDDDNEVLHSDHLQDDLDHHHEQQSSSSSSSTPSRPQPNATTTPTTPRTTTETVKYWIIRNSWNDQAQENGYFRMYRGDNATKACYIQAEAYAAKF